MRTELLLFLVGGCALVLYLEAPHVLRTLAEDLQGPYPHPEVRVAADPLPGLQSARQAPPARSSEERD